MYMHANLLCNYCQFYLLVLVVTTFVFIFSERELVVYPSVCLSVCNVRAPDWGDWNFRQRCPSCSADFVPFAVLYGLLWNK